MLALITATRNSMETLPESLASVGNSRRRVKHFFVDGASTDGTIDYLRSFAADLGNVVYQDQHGEGLYEAINQGIQAALLDPDVTHIGMLHSDDCLISEAYEDYLAQIDKSSADIYYSDIQFHGDSRDVVRVWRSGKFSRFKLRTGWMPPHTSMIVRKSIYNDIGLYNTEFGTAADYEWIVRVFSARGDSIFYFPQRTVTMLVGGASSVTIKARLRANAMDGRVWAGQSNTQAALIRMLKPVRKIGQFVSAIGMK